MKTTLFCLALGLILHLTGSLQGGEERILFRNPSQVKVQYQAKRPDMKSWSTFTTVLNNAATESMMENQLMQRHPGNIVRILAASTGAYIPVTVKCQIRRKNAPWTTMTTILNNALTESMARNQISAKYPETEVRILSMVVRDNAQNRRQSP